MNASKMLYELRKEHIRLIHEEKDKIIYSYQNDLKLREIKAKMRIVELFINLQNDYKKEEK